MKKTILFLLLLTLIACGSNATEIQDEIKSDIIWQQVSITNSELEDKKNKDISENDPKLNFELLYPFLKESLLEIVCEPYRIEEESNSLTAYSKDSDMFLSSWSWDLNTQPLLIKDIDNDGLIDYTIELSNEGGGCGGQIGESERWTLYGSKPDIFIWTHTIPYRSESGNWEKN